MTSKARNIADLGSNDVIETTATGVDVTGTVTADGLTVDGSSDQVVVNGTNSAGATLVFLKDNNTNGTGIIHYNESHATLPNQTWIKNYTASGDIHIAPNNQKALTTESNGDVSFYEDTGTTAKMVWDASAESLGIGSNAATVGNINTRKDADADVIGVYISNESTGASASSTYWNDAQGNNFYITTYGDGHARSNETWLGSTAGSSQIVFAPNNTERMRIDSSGNVGLRGTGVTSEDVVNKLDFYSTTSSMNLAGIQGRRTAGGTNYGSLIFTTTSGGSSTEKARINSSGQLLVSTTTGVATGSISNAQIETVAKANENCIATQVVTSGYAALASSGITSAGGGYHFYGYMVNSSGSNVGSIRVNHNGVVYNTTSDERLKENIQDTTHTVDINDIQVRQFDWKDGGNHERYGFIAQELEAVYPEAVTRPDSDDEMMSVDYSKLVPLLVKEIQTLKARIETLENN